MNPVSCGHEEQGAMVLLFSVPEERHPASFYASPSINETDTCLGGLGVKGVNALFSNTFSL